VRALDGLDLVAESGHVTTLLGPNGAGKTTFISAVATLLRPDGGEIRVAGVDVCAEKEVGRGRRRRNARVRRMCRRKPFQGSQARPDQDF
jgi:ABC-type multidrug transport system ATPase subunit